MRFGFGGKRSMDRTEPAVSRVPDAPVNADLPRSNIPLVARRRPTAPLHSLRAVESAITDRLTSGWTTTPLNADQIVANHQPILVARSREEAQKNDYMKSFLRMCDRNIVGHRGFSLQAQSRGSDGSLDRLANEALEAWWRDWQKAQNCDVTGRRSFRRLCKGAVNSAAKDGEFMFREIFGRAAGPMGYSLQIIDPQRCPVDYNVDANRDGVFVKQGIEFSRAGRPLAYYFTAASDHGFGYSHQGAPLERVPADQIIHGFLEDIVGQRRGLPWASTSLWRLHMLGGFERAALTSARTGASVGGFFQWKDGYGPGDEEDQGDDEELFVETDGGTFQELPEGAEMKELNNQYPTGEFAPFHKAMLRGAGAGMGVSYPSFANDLEGVNFSSIRQGVLDERDHWMDLQEWLVETLIDRCYQRALTPALLMGLIKVNGTPLSPLRRSKYSVVYWQGRRWAWVDPTKDVKAEVDAKNNMLTSPSEIIRRRGEDPDTVWRNFAGDIAAMRSAGVPESFIMASVLGIAPGTTPAADPPKAGDGDGDPTENDEESEDEDPEE